MKEPSVLEGEDDEKKRVYDSSVDHKGNPPLRASTGVWRASLFIIAIEFAERLSFFGLSTNFIIYLTKVLKQDVKTAARNVNYWSGVTTMMPLIGGFMADAYLGRFLAVLVSSIIYLAGLGLLTMSQLVPGLKLSESLQRHKVVFFTAMYLISVATGGHKPSLQSFGANQFDDDHTNEKKQKMSFFNWWNCGLCGGLLLGVTIIVYIEDKVSWVMAYIVLTSVMTFGLVIFVSGKQFYRYRVPEGSPLTPLLRVVVAAFAKRNIPYPSSAEELCELPRDSNRSAKRLLCHTNYLRFLDKAAVIEHKPTTETQNPWRLTTVTEVEELKLILSTFPIWLSSIPFGLCVAQASTFFVKQASIMNRKLAGSFEIPPASIYALGSLAMMVAVIFYDKILVPVLRRATGNQRGMSILRRMGIGMAFSIAAMAAAATIERRRRTAAATMSVFWLAPQYIILGFGDGFTLVGLQEYFYEQVPDNMRSLGIAFYLSVIGGANFASSALITVVDKLTDDGRSAWFGKELNHGHLDYFYWLLACINGVNLCGYMYLTSR